MAIYKRDIVDINLESGNIHRTFLAHTIGYKDQKADHFGVRVFRDGEAVSLTGVSVQGVFMPPQGSPIAITSGNIVSGNTAEVVLPQACYDYNGQFCLAIKLVDSSNSVTGTVRIVDGVVDNTHASGTVAPTSAVPTYQEVLSAYEQAIAVIGSSVRFDTTQSLTTVQKTTARGNIDAASTDDVSDLKSAISDIVFTAFNKLDWNPTITKGYYVGKDSGKIVSNTFYARTNLLYGYRTRIIVNLSSETYRCRIHYYDSTGSLTTGAGYLGCTPYDAMTNGIFYIPATYNGSEVAQFALSFRRSDDATITDSDVMAIKAALSAYAATDDTLTQKGMAADAKATGDLLLERKQDIEAINDLLYSKNLVSKDILTDKQYINATSGELASSQYFSATEGYVDISGIAKLAYTRIYVTIGTTSVGIAFYDSDKVFISGVTNAVDASEEHVEIFTTNVPENAKYARFTYQQFSALDRFPPFAVYNALDYFDAIGAQNDIPKKLKAVSDYVSADHISWESGVISNRGTELSDSQSIRTVQYIKAKKGTAVYGGLDVSFRVSMFSEPKPSAFIERTNAYSRTNKWFYVPNDCYIRIHGNWSPATTVSDIAELAEQFHIIHAQTEKTFDIFGTKQFYLSEPTAETETNINTKTLTELYAIYDDLCTNYPQIIRRLENIGMDASNTYEIREYEIALKYKLVYEGEVSLSGDLDIEHLTNLWSTNMDNPTIGLQIGIHGNEKAPTWAAALAIKEIVESDDDYATFLKSNFNFRIIPCANPYGFQNDIRRNSNNVDINRNFNNLTQSESVAIANWMYGLVGKACLILAVHGTTGYYAYYSVNGKSPYFDDYCKQCMQFTTAAQNNWAEFYGMDKAPYCYTVKTTYAGTMGELQNKIGIPGFTLETPQNYSHGDQYVWDNDLRSCKLTKDLLINALQNAGEWSMKLN